MKKCVYTNWLVKDKVNDMQWFRHYYLAGKDAAYMIRHGYGNRIKKLPKPAYVFF